MPLCFCWEHSYPLIFPLPLGSVIVGPFCQAQCWSMHVPTTFQQAMMTCWCRSTREQSAIGVSSSSSKL